MLIYASNFTRLFNDFGNVIFLGYDLDIGFLANTLNRVVPLDFHNLIFGSKFLSVVIFLDMRHRSLFAQNLFIVMYLELVMGMRQFHL